MALALLFALLFALPSNAAAARVAAKDAQEVPWRKPVVLATLLGHAHAGDVAAGLPERDIRRASDFATQPQGDAYGQVQALLVDIFGGGKADPVASGKLMDSLRRDIGMEDGDFVHRLQASLSSASSRGARRLVRSNEGVGQDVEQLIVTQPGDSQGVVIARYPSQDHPSAERVNGVHRLLLGVELSHMYIDNGIFLYYFAQSHTAEEFAMDSGAEVLLLRERSFGTFREVVQTGNYDYKERLSLFIQALLLVQQMNQLGIPHRPEITPDTVYSLRESVDLEPIGVALSPAMLLAQQEMSAQDLWNSDIRQLGTLLRFLFSGEWLDGEQNVVDVLLAFGKAMENGAVPGNKRAFTEFIGLIRKMAPGSTDEALARLRLQYLKRAVDAEISAQQHRAQAAV